MPLLIRACRVADLPPGASLEVTLHGQPMHVRNDGGAFRAIASGGGPLHRLGRLLSRKGSGEAREGAEFRTEVRGDYVFVALDRDREDAPAEIQQNARTPEPV